MVDRVPDVKKGVIVTHISPAPSVEGARYVTRSSVSMRFGAQSFNPDGAGSNPDLFENLDMLLADIPNVHMGTLRDLISHIAGCVMAIQTPKDHSIVVERLRRFAGIVDEKLGHELSLRGGDEPTYAPSFSQGSSSGSQGPRNAYRGYNASDPYGGEDTGHGLQFA